MPAIGVFRRNLRRRARAYAAAVAAGIMTNTNREATTRHDKSSFAQSEYEVGKGRRQEGKDVVNRNASWKGGKRRKELH